MKLPFKIVLINVGVAIWFSLLLCLGSGSSFKKEFLTAFGLTGLIAGLLEIIIGLFLLLLADKRYAQGFLLSAGILLLLGFVACSNVTFSVH